MNIELASTIISALGIAMLFSSIGMYIKRTGDKTALTRFWASKAELSKSELITNRLGLLFALVGILFPIFVQ